MLPPKHLYSAAVINKHEEPQEVHVTYTTEGKEDIVEKQVIKPNTHHVFAQRTFVHPETKAEHTYHINHIRVPDKHELKGPYVETPTKEKAFELIKEGNEGSVTIKESKELRVFQ